MAGTASMPKDFDEAVLWLAGWHRQEAPQIVEIYQFPDPGRSEIRLIEVNPDTPATGEAMVFSFGRQAPDFPFRTAVGEVTPEEWEQIKRGVIPLPPGWDRSQARRIA